MILEIHRKLIRCAETYLKLKSGRGAPMLLMLYSLLTGVLFVLSNVIVEKCQNTDAICYIISVMCLSFFFITGCQVCLKTLTLDLKELEKLREEREWKQ